MKIARRIGSTPQQRGSISGQTCPDVFETTDGDYLIIGTDATDELADQLPDDVIFKPGGRIIIVPAVLMADAKPDLPDV